MQIHPGFCEHLILGKTSAKLLKEIDRRLVTCPRASPSLSLLNRRPPVPTSYRRASRNAGRTSEIWCQTVNTWSKYRHISHVFKCSSTARGGWVPPGTVYICVFESISDDFEVRSATVPKGIPIRARSTVRRTSARWIINDPPRFAGSDLFSNDPVRALLLYRDNYMQITVRGTRRSRKFPRKYQFKNELRPRKSGWGCH